MEWFKQYTSDGTDPRLEILTDAQHRTWFRLECLAGKTGGVIPPKPARLLALEVAGRDEPLLAATIAVLVELEWVDVEADGAIAFLDRKRFTRKPSDEPEAARVRQAKSRDARKQEAPVTSCHAPVTRDMSGHAIERKKEEREETEGGDRAQAREAAAPFEDADDFTQELDQPVPGKPIAAGHPFDVAQLERIKAAMPDGQFFDPGGMPHKVRMELGLYVDRGELQPECLSSWKALDTELKVAWFVEGLRRAVTTKRKPVYRVAYAAKQIGMALQNGVDLMKDGWTPPGQAQGQQGKITQFPDRQQRGSVAVGLAVPDDIGAKATEAAAVAVKLATVDGKRRADLEACSGVRLLVSRGALPAKKLTDALELRQLTMAELDAYDAEKAQEVAHG